MPVFGSNPLSGLKRRVPFRRKSKMYVVNEPEPTYNVVYLGNVLTVMAKGEGCADKALALIWKTYEQRTRPDMPMTLSVTRQGLKAETKQQGLTEYWAHRTTYCIAPPNYPRVFCWIYKHEGKRMKPELRCHAVLCRRPNEPSLIALKLVEHLQAALAEYKREMVAKQNTRLSGLITGYSSLPRRKHSLITGSKHFRPPVSRSKSAPKLGNIEEDEEESDDDHVSEADVEEEGLLMSPVAAGLGDPSVDFDSDSLSIEVRLVPGTPSASSYKEEDGDSDSLQPSPSCSEHSTSTNDSATGIGGGDHRLSHRRSAPQTYVVDLEIGNDLDKLRLAGAGLVGHRRGGLESDSGSDSTTSEESGYHEKSSLEEDEEVDFAAAGSDTTVVQSPCETDAANSDADDSLTHGKSVDSLTHTGKSAADSLHRRKQSADQRSIITIDDEPPVPAKSSDSRPVGSAAMDRPSNNTVEIVVSF